MVNDIRLSIVIPAFNASNHIRKALESIYSDLRSDETQLIEVIVVDDGSSDSSCLKKILGEFPDVTLLNHCENKGMCASRNTGISATRGQYVTLLDSDDEFVCGWWKTFLSILGEWPSEAQVCYTPCVNGKGEVTCKTPGFQGWFTAEDLVSEKHSGEYNPVFNGDYIRLVGYYDLKTRKSCGLMSYLKMVRMSPFWISNRVMRRYNDNVSGSVTSGWMNPEKAKETYLCFTTVLEHHGAFIERTDPAKHKEMKLKVLVYQMLSNNGRDFITLWKIRSFNLSWLGAMILLVVGPTKTGTLVALSKRLKLIRRYG